MSNYSLFKRISAEFLDEVKINDIRQSFLVGIVCGFYLQHKRSEIIEVLKKQLGFIQQIINSGLSNDNLFDDSILNLIKNLEAPEPFDFQAGYQNQEKREPKQVEKREKLMEYFQNFEDEEDRSLELIKRLQAEDEETQKMLNRQIEDEQVDCPICYTSLMDDDVYPLEHCIHTFHLSCLKEYINGAIAERRREILCPDDSCKIQLAVLDIGQVAGQDKQQEFEQYTFNQFVDLNAADMSWCPTPDCKYAFVLDEYDMNKEFICKLCKKHYCLNCRVPYHKGQSCKEYQITHTRDKNDEKFEKFVKGHKFKMCHKCKFWVEKDQGCNHMTCRCGYEFCYLCGGKYQHCECIRKAREFIERQREQQQQIRVRGVIRGGNRSGNRGGIRGGFKDRGRGRGSLQNYDINHNQQVRPQIKYQ